VTADSDFISLAGKRGCPPKVVYLERCDFPLRVIEYCLRSNAIRIAEFQADSGAGLLAIRL
jgi:predicted nuclease of predicted toxin-antitoxin system